MRSHPALSDDPLIQRFFVAAGKRVAIINSIPGVGAVEIDIETANKLSTTLRIWLCPAMYED